VSDSGNHLPMSRWQLFRTRLHMLLVGIRRRMVLGARVAVFDGDRVLLIRHTYIPGWHFPGGGVEPGESAAHAARREMLEEVGLEPTEPLRLVGFYHNLNPATARDHLALFVCRAHAVRRVFRPNAEIAEIGWFALDALPEGVDPGTARRVAEIVGGGVVAERW
jgi:8-oxo-dGTP pyrophosphatase MutT (NUDIX family)